MPNTYIDTRKDK